MAGTALAAAPAVTPAPPFREPGPPVTRDELLPHLVAALANVGADIPLATVLALAEDLAPRLAGNSKPQRAEWAAWTTGDEDQLRHLYEVEGATVAKIAADLGKSAGAIRGAISRLNLHRPHGYKQPGRPPK